MACKFNHSLIDRHLGWAQFLATVNKAIVFTGFDLCTLGSPIFTQTYLPLNKHLGSAPPCPLPWRATECTFGPSKFCTRSLETLLASFSGLVLHATHMPSWGANSNQVTHLQGMTSVMALLSCLPPHPLQLLTEGRL